MSSWGVPGFAVERELGSGASGRVVAAVHVATGTRVAIKYLSSRLLAAPGYLETFRSEAALLRTLNVPQVVRLFDYAEAPGQGAAIIMELVAGVSLHEMITRRGPTGSESALVVLKGSLLGLAAAHSLGIVHRDYKPENVLVDGQGTSKLTDFGVAVRTGDNASPGGTPLYMAPEQWNGLPPTPATDIYAATAVFFECLTGQTPFSGSLGQLAARHATAEVPVELVDERLRDLIVRGMAKDPAARPASATELVAELEAIAAIAYGEDWEPAGRAHLAEAAAALVPLLSGTAAAAAVTTGAVTTGTGAGAATTTSWLGTVTSAIAAHAVLYTGIIAAVIGIVGGSLVAVSRAATSHSASTGASTAAPAARPSVSTATQAAPPAASASATSPPSTTPAPTATPSTPASGASAIGPCPTSGLTVAVDWSVHDAAAERSYFPLEFTNTSGQACTLYGYPGVALTTSMTPSSQVGAQAGRVSSTFFTGTPDPPTLVTLAPGATASATLQIVNVAVYDKSSCGQVSATYVQVYPPGQTSAVYVPYKYTGLACSKPVYQMQVETVAPGTALR